MAEEVTLSPQLVAAEQLGWWLRRSSGSSRSESDQRVPEAALISRNGRRLPPGGPGMRLRSGPWIAAVDFSAAALARGRSIAEAAGAGLAQRIDWLERDLGTWSPDSARYMLAGHSARCLSVQQRNPRW